MTDPIYPVVVIGAGPVGLAAAAHLTRRNLPFVVLEAGAQIAASVRAWGHVRLFSPWRYVMDDAARALLAETCWQEPDGVLYPTGAELVDQYLVPLAAHPALAPQIRTGHRVVAVARQNHDKMQDAGRADAPFLVRYIHDGHEDQLLARAVIDASGTWAMPNPLGANGLVALGEHAAADRIAYGIPDMRGAERARYAGRRVLVVGSGHSAFNALLDLAQLPDTPITWAVRRTGTRQLFGGGTADGLAERGKLGTRAQQLVASGAIRLETGFRTTRVVTRNDAMLVNSDDGRSLGPFDEIIGCTGFRPDLAALRELRLELDPSVEAPGALAPLIDPNLHSCGSVPPHGVDELSHPETNFYIVGMKSYGRAPTFLLLTGYEQVRSVVAALAGDWAAARDVHLVLPETGVCVSDREDGCCGVPQDRSTAAFGQLVIQLSNAAALQTTCCTPVAQTTCCAPEEKTACCGASGDACGCAAGG